MADFGDRVLAELERLLAPREVPVDLAELTPAERQQALPLELRQEIAREAGARGSRAYASAMRRMQRYITGAGEARLPAGAQLVRLDRSLGIARMRERDTAVSILGWVRVSKDLRHRHVGATIPAADMQPVVRAFVAGDHGTAVNLFLDAFISAYAGVPVAFESVDSVRLTLVSAEAAA